MIDVIENAINNAFIIGALGGASIVILVDLSIFAIRKAWYLFKSILHK